MLEETFDHDEAAQECIVMVRRGGMFFPVVLAPPVRRSLRYLPDETREPHPAISDEITQYIVTGRPGGAFPLVFSMPPATWRRLRYLSDEAREPIIINMSYLHGLGLAERDRLIVELVGELGYVTTDQVARLFYAHAKNPNSHARRELLRLWKKHVLDRIAGYALDEVGLPVQLVYTLGDAGWALLLEQEAEDRLVPPWCHGTELLIRNVLTGELITRITERLRTSKDSEWQVSYYGRRVLTFRRQGSCVR